MNKKLISSINEIQNALNEANVRNFNLPQIVVVGEQSTGKSSVLESIVGIDFLPKGTGIVTRRPLVLQLIRIKVPKNEEQTTINNNYKPFATFQHTGEKKFYDFNNVSQEIANETKRSVEGKNISSKEIILRIFSTQVTNLTLVDLPGLTQNPIKNQPKNISDQIEKLVLNYITKSKSLILTVIPANQDIANSRSILLAKRVDPKGKRTLGVLTKIDLMDKETDIVDVLNGSQLPLKYGYVPVINRSQQEINDNISPLQARANEKKFFQNHSKYSNLSDRCGVSFLTKKLSKLFKKHIKKQLPKVRTEVYNQIIRLNKELQQMGNNIENKKPFVLTQLMNHFTQSYIQEVDGKQMNQLTNNNNKNGLNSNSNQILPTKMHINHVFHKIFSEFINNINPKKNLQKNQVRILLTNTKGTKSTLFLPENSFELLVKKKIELLRKPALECSQRVLTVLLKAVSQGIEIKELERFPILKKKLIKKSKQFLKQLLENTKEFINDLIDIELAFIDTSHPDFIPPTELIKHNLHAKESQNYTNNHYQKKVKQKNNKLNFKRGSSKNTKEKKREKDLLKNDENDNNFTLMKMPNEMKDPIINENSEKEVELIMELMTNYFSIVKKKVQDTIPKSVMRFLITDSKQKLLKHLSEHLFNSEKIDYLLAEDEGLAKRRKICMKELEGFEKSSQILSKLDLKLN
ncbi:vacuolar protein sorting-associated protein [Anaeramoeba flamelloides]|uniref:Vacuolar protein sorting-associated protein n=1 Tax=Anaeramoeba flamelloides TaxID=1746091 RepID=A0ABQ8YIF5_9EUKA|nr:vacuolar protein sorting-associated protein [Anaeramoeba flamelloides]